MMYMWFKFEVKNSEKINWVYKIKLKLIVTTKTL